MSGLLFLESSKNVGGQELRMLTIAKGLDPQHFQVWVAARRNSALYRRREEWGVDIQPVSMRNALDVVGVLQLVRLIRRHHIRTVVTYSGKDAWLGLIAGRLCGCRVLRMKNLALFKHKTAYNLSDAVIVPSAYLRDFLLERGVRADKIQIIYPGVDIAHFSFDAASRARIRQYYEYGEQDKVLIYTAFLRRTKAQHTLIEALRQLADPTVKLLLIGDGYPAYAAELRHQVEAAGLTQQVIFCGRVASSELPAYLSAGDIFVFPSLTESFGRALLEAMACGLPVVAHDIPAVREVLGDGLLYAHDDPALLREQLATCLSRLPACRAGAQQNRERVTTNFSLASMLNAFETLFTFV